MTTPALARPEIGATLLTTALAREGSVAAWSSAGGSADGAPRPFQGDPG